MLNATELLIMAHLRHNSRASLTSISKKTNMPISTVYEKLKHRYTGVIQKYTTLVNFTALGYATRANLILRVEKKQRDAIRNYLLNHQNVNSLYRINNGYDFLLDCVFTTMKELDSFLEYLDNKFLIHEKQVYYMIEDLKREEFLSKPETIQMMQAMGEFGGKK